MFDANELICGNKRVYCGLTQYEFFATYIFNNRCSSVDKERKKILESEQSHVFESIQGSTENRKCGDLREV